MGGVGARAGAGLTEEGGGATRAAESPGSQQAAARGSLAELVGPGRPISRSPEGEILSGGSADTAGWVQGLLSPTPVAHHQRSRMQRLPAPAPSALTP